MSAPSLPPRHSAYTQRTVKKIKTTSQSPIKSTIHVSPRGLKGSSLYPNASVPPAFSFPSLFLSPPISSFAQTESAHALTQHSHTLFKSRYRASPGSGHLLLSLFQPPLQVYSSSRD
ncbi:hypothetical protein L249_0633 [Ophiocordyceps polyrhachis-furcata BCC 54312]|uniref:Uncharacterized protein n=1 Tax=Ophiocordyceps polyrhachis-furcata BCC 54312 TaxID=1330021 RepID=A0A367LG00_9HYPO|nr:hypothetical protein L249_0633 [Ophiocordyceps polyrhachis-furcata BCC 54312]